MHSAEPGAVVCVGASGLNALAILRALGRRGVPVQAVALRGSAQIASFSRYCRRLTKADTPDALYWALRRIGEGLAARPALFVDNDAMLRALSPHAHALERWFELVDPIERAIELTDKQFQLRVAREAGLPVPASWYPREAAEVIALDRQTTRRLIAKPVTPSAAFKVLIAEDALDLLNQLGAHGADASSIIVQEFIEGGDGALYSAYAYRPASGGAPVVFTSRKLRQNPPGAGVMTVGEPCDAPEVREMTLALVRALDYRGMLSVEFKRDADSGRYYFVEWNPRFDACHSLSWQAGFDGAYIAYRDRAHGEAPAAVEPRYGSGHAWINFDCELHNFAKQPSRLLRPSTWKPYLRRHEWAVFAADDPAPFFAAAAGTARWMTRGFLRRLPQPLRAGPLPLRSR